MSSWRAASNTTGRPPAEDKIIQICRTLGSTEYVNSVGGRKLYTKASFESKGCHMPFIEMDDVRYRQRSGEFVANLSMIDVLMHCPKPQARSLLDAYRLG